MLVCGSVSVVAQIGNNNDGRIDDRMLDSRGDTVLTTRMPSEWRIGPMLSATMNYHFGTLNVAMNPVIPGHGNYQLEPGGFGGGGFGIGFVYEYGLPNEEWNFSLMSNLLDYRSTTTYTQMPGFETSPTLALDNNIITSVSQFYITVMPQARYNFREYPGMYMLMGLDIDFGAYSTMTRLNTYYEDERVDIQREINFNINPLRVGVNIGLGYDIFAGLVKDYRMTLSPFVLLHAGSPYYTKNGSTWNGMVARAGLALKFGEDIITDTLLRRDPNAGDAQPVVASMKDDKLNVVMPESKGMFIAMLIPNMTSADLNLPDYTKTVNSDKTPAAAGSNAGSAIKVTANKVQTFNNYSTPFDTSLNVSLRSYLNNVADFLKNNPRAEVRIVGHADNFGGSPTETQRISDERALQVVRYLVSKGISRDRLLASGLGARKPVQDNRKAAGRTANRRVEITIVQ